MFHTNKKNEVINIRQMFKYIVCCLSVALLLVEANAVSAADIKLNIDAAKVKQNEAHQIAEYVRSFGENDSHPAIQFAKEKWYEQQAQINDLYKQYDAVNKDEQQNKGTYVGRFRISHYCPCSTCNGGYVGSAIGTPLFPWHTIAVDPAVIKLNSTVYIEGYGDFKAQDTGGAIKGTRIDVCVNDHAEAYRLGVVYRDVYVKSA